MTSRSFQDFESAGRLAMSQEGRAEDIDYSCRKFAADVLEPRFQPRIVGITR